jgi:hypothetical protein
MAHETLTVEKSHVHIDEKGVVTIRDPRVIEQLKSRGVNNEADLKSKAAVSVGIVVSF